MWGELAVQAAVEAGSRAGLDVSGARVLRVGESAVVLLPAAGVLAKVVADAAPAEEIRRELWASGWLAELGVPVSRPARSTVLVASGCVVSLWEYMPDAGPARLTTLAGCLRRLHAVPFPTRPMLDPLRPFAGFQERLASAGTLRAGDRSFLAAFRDRLGERWESAQFALPPCVIHGDAHMDNLLVSADGRVAFVDFGGVAIGPPEWDLTLTALYYECGWFTTDQYQEFAAAYGYDVRSAESWAVLRDTRMLRMTTWLAQTAKDFPERDAQLRHRIRSLEDGSAPAGWTGF